MVADFFNSALPWVGMGLGIAILAAYCNTKAINKDKKAQK